MDGRPTLRGGFVPVGVVGRGVEDGDADVAGGVDWAMGISRKAFCLIGLVRGVLFGWNIGDWNVILGGRRGYSGGKVRWAR